MTVKEWLALSDYQLAIMLEKVLPLGPGKHNWQCQPERGSHPKAEQQNWLCIKCLYYREKAARYELLEGPCLVPDPITIDWNTTMEWFRKSHECLGQLREIYFIVCQEAVNRPTFPWWVLYEAQPEHYLIAAAMAEENEK